MNKLWKVTAHEFRRIAGARVFIILTILGPFLITVMGVAPALLSTRQQSRVVEIDVPGCPEDLYRQAAPILETLKIHLTRSEESPTELDARVRAGKLYGYLLIPPDPAARSLELVTREVADFKLVEILKGVLGQAIVDARLRAAGLESSSFRELLALPEIANQQITKKGEKVQANILSTILVGVAFTMMLYMTIMLYGQSIGRSVVQEKTSRTVEIMLSSVDVKELLFGKLFGQAAASLLQYAVWIGMALLFLSLLGPLLKVNSLPQLTGTLPLYLVLYFLLGFFLYASLYAALGAAAEDEQNLGQLSWPVLIFLMVPMVFVGPVSMNPEAVLSVFMSMFPMTSPIVMFIRILLSEPPAWQIAVSVALAAASIIIVMYLAAKIFRVGILMLGKRFKLGEILRWLRV